MRTGARYLLKLDISQFYPSLYTHAVGWAVSPELRQRANWQNQRLLGKQLDQSLMNMQGKISQGIPIGPDTSFLLAEVVLAAVDKAAGLKPENALRWYDDYEVACSDRQEAEAALKSLRAALAHFKLRPNLLKTSIVSLPAASGDGWQAELSRLSEDAVRRSASMAKYFDRAFQMAERSPGSPVLMYAMGCLFEARPPDSYAFEVALGAITQAVLSEPGCAQKAFALLTYWHVCGIAINGPALTTTINRLFLQHSARGESSDLAWALAFAIQHGCPLSKTVGRELGETEDDVVLLEALHAHAVQLLPGLNVAKVEKRLALEACNGEHWLALYEAVRHGWAPRAAAIVQGDAFLGDMLKADVSFYDLNVRPYAMVIAPGGAPQWIVDGWLRKARHRTPKALARMSKIERMLAKDLSDKRTASNGAKDRLKRLQKTKEKRGRQVAQQY